MYCMCVLVCGHPGTPDRSRDVSVGHCGDTLGVGREMAEGYTGRETLEELVTAEPCFPGAWSSGHRFGGTHLYEF